jgi:hypothetical protein
MVIEIAPQVVVNSIAPILVHSSAQESAHGSFLLKDLLPTETLARSPENYPQA